MNSSASCSKPRASTIGEILDGASDGTRATLRVLGQLLCSEPSTSISPTQFAVRHLGVEAVQLARTKHEGARTSLTLLGHMLGLEMTRHAGGIVVGSLGSGLLPTWSRLEIGSGDPIPVPGQMIVFFPAGTLADVPLCVLIDDRHWEREFAILSAATARGTAERLLADFRARLKSALNPLRGRVLEASVEDCRLRISPSAGVASERAALMLPEQLWDEVDVFIASATKRGDLLRALGLGTKRGLLVAGPPGVGKTHLVRVIAAELAGRYTTILADAASIRHSITDLYAESENFGPTLIVLDDIDLVVGHRDGSGHNQALADFLSALDGVRQRDDILTIATTNDPASLDPAAQRTSRFDTVLSLPMPDARCRAGILERHLGPLGLGIDFAEVAEALDGASGADVKEVVRRAVLEHGGTFTRDQLLDVAESGRWQSVVDRGRYLAPVPSRRRSRTMAADCSARGIEDR